MFCACLEILEQIVGTSNHITLSIRLLKNVAHQWSEIFLAAPVTLYRHFSLSPRTVYASFTPKCSIVCVAIAGRRGQTYLST